MKKLLFLLPILALSFCKKEAAPRIFNRTCVTTQHHDLIIGDIKVYVKYNATDFNFPGYEDIAEYDTVFTTNAQGKGCIENLPIGKHWLVGIGFDPAINQGIEGRDFVEVSFENPEVDMILYVGEE